MSKLIWFGIVFVTQLGLIKTKPLCTRNGVNLLISPGIPFPGIPLPVQHNFGLPSLGSSCNKPKMCNCGRKTFGPRLHPSPQIIEPKQKSEDSPEYGRKVIDPRFDIATTDFLDYQVPTSTVLSSSKIWAPEPVTDRTDLEYLISLIGNDSITSSNFSFPGNISNGSGRRKREVVDTADETGNLTAVAEVRPNGNKTEIDHRNEPKLHPISSLSTIIAPENPFMNFVSDILDHIESFINDHLY